MKILTSLCQTMSVATAAPQGGGGLGNLNALHLGHSLLVASPFTTEPQELPGVFGRLRVDPGAAIIVEFDKDQQSVVDFLESFGPAAEVFHFQMLRADEQGYHLSTVRRVGQDHELRFAAQQTRLDRAVSRWTTSAAPAARSPGR